MNYTHSLRELQDRLDRNEVQIAALTAMLRAILVNKVVEHRPNWRQPIAVMREACSYSARALEAPPALRRAAENEVSSQFGKLLEAIASAERAGILSGGEPPPDAD